LIPISLDLKWVSCPQHSVCRYVSMVFAKTWYQACDNIHKCSRFAARAILAHLQALSFCKP
jgi:hypothetical protein